MGILSAIILGIIEGATEFIPVSSTGHLIIARQFLGINNSYGLSFDAVLQLATALALVAYFWSDILRLINSFFAWVLRKPLEQKERVLLASIIIGTVPAVIAGLLLEKKMETIFRDVHLVAWALLAGSVLMWLAQRFSSENKILTLSKGIIIGFFQCLALVPGVSRSGATISGGLFSGLSRDEAVRFSFLLSVPILLGSGLKKLFEIRGDLVSSGLGLPLLFGSIAAFIVGLISIQFLIKYLRRRDLNLFIYYRIVLFLAIFLIF